MEEFVEQGYGRRPRHVFSNQMAIIGPKSDPAHIRGMTSAPTRSITSLRQQGPDKMQLRIGFAMKR